MVYAQEMPETSLSGSCAAVALTHSLTQLLRLQVISQITGDTMLPWEDPYNADRGKLGAYLGPVMALLSRNPAYRPSAAVFVDSCTSLLAENNLFENLKHSGPVLKDSDDRQPGAATCGTVGDQCSGVMDDLLRQSSTRTIEWSESIPLQDEMP
jgi:hypothetical protein